jgi:HEAT repeat protein
VTPRRVGSIAALLIVGGAAAAFARAARHEPAFAQGSEREHPGPDSARVAKVLDALAATDPLLCAMLTEQIGNYWSSNGRDGFGTFADAPPSLQAARDSMHHAVRDPKAITLLVARLQGDAACPRRAAAKMLGNSVVSTSRLVELLNTGAPRVQEAAAFSLGHDERAGARSALEAKMTSTSEPIASMAAWALSQMHDSVPASTFMRALDSRFTRVRVAGALGLGHHDGQEHRVPLERALRGENEAVVRDAIVRALGDVGSPLSAPVLATALADPDRRVRLSAANSLGDLNELEKAPAALVRAAESDDEELAMAAINALAEIHDPETVDVLIARLSSPSRDVRLRVIEGLSNIGSQKAVPGLMRALRDPDAEVRRAAAEALGEIKEGSN